MCNNWLHIISQYTYILFHALYVLTPSLLLQTKEQMEQQRQLVANPPLLLAIPTLSMIPQVHMHTTICICIYAPLLTLPYLNLMPIDRNSHFCIIIF